MFHSLRRKLRRKRVLILLCCCGLVVALSTLHFVFLPKFTGAYNDDCYLEEKKLNELRYLILSSAKLMEKYNITYWLDYGTLLGAVKYGDVLPWDGDGDISSIRNTSFDPGEMNKEFATKYGIQRNALVASVNNTSIDYYRWTVANGTFNGRRQTLINMYYPERIWRHENTIVKLQHHMDRLPVSWILPTRKIKFRGVPVSVPGQYEKCLRARYPLTYQYNINTPYKWKCWLPCWLLRTRRCRS